MRKFLDKTKIISLTIAVAFGLYSTHTLARPDYFYTEHVVGTVVSINMSNNSFTIANPQGTQTNIMVFPETRFKLKYPGKGKKYEPVSKITAK